MAAAAAATTTTQAAQHSAEKWRTAAKRVCVRARQLYELPLAAVAAALRPLFMRTAQSLSACLCVCVRSRGGAWLPVCVCVFEHGRCEKQQQQQQRLLNWFLLFFLTRFFSFSTLYTEQQQRVGKRGVD